MRIAELSADDLLTIAGYENEVQKSIIAGLEKELQELKAYTEKIKAGVKLSSENIKLKNESIELQNEGIKLWNEGVIKKRLELEKELQESNSL